jgi:DNA mismatch endonuclease (patch repair protein)
MTRFTSDAAEVSARMRLIKAKDTKPELALETMLLAAGIECSKHERVEGISVDLVIDDRVCVFVDSPFWHFRDASLLDRLNDYWQERLRRNRRRDRRQNRSLRHAGYCVIRLWSDQLTPSAVLPRVRRARTIAHRRAA